MAMTLISTVTVGSGGAASIDFNSISGAFTDLLMVYSVRTSSTNGGLRVKVNGSTANLSTRLLYGTGASVSPATDTTYIGTTNNSNQTANTFGNGNFYIANYAGGVAKAFIADLIDENNVATPVNEWITGGRFNSSTAITSLSLVNDASANFVQYSTATLYGILKGSSGGVTIS